MSVKNPLLRFLLRLWSNFITSNIPYEGDNPFKQKYFVVKFINVIDLIILVITVPYITPNFHTGVVGFFSSIFFNVSNLVNTLTIILAFANIYILRKTKNIDWGSTIFVLLLYLNAMFLLYAGNDVVIAADNVAVVLYLMPFVLFMVKGAKKGLIASLGLYAIVGLMLLQPELYQIVAKDNRILYTVANSPSLLALIFFYQYINERYARLGEANKDELVQTLENLSKEKSKIETTLSSIADGVFAVTVDGHIALMNPIAEKMSGHTFESSHNKPYSEIFNFKKENKPTDSYPNFVEEIIQKGKVEPFITNIVLLSKAGTSMPLAVSAAPLTTKKGDIIGAVVVMHDVTQERELVNSKILFVNVAAHKLRTPLAIIRWKIEDLLTGDKKIPEKVKQAIEVLENTTLRVIKLVNELLTILQIDEENLANDLQPTDISAKIKDAILEIKKMADKKSITIVFNNQAEKLPPLTLDSTHFQEVVASLLSNSIDYNKEKGKITIQLERKDDHIVLRVIDTGIGIPPEEHPKVFTKFYRSKEALLLQTEGSGLGLFIAKNYIESWGGKIYFTSPIDKTEKGTEFVIELPLAFKKP